MSIELLKTLLPPPRRKSNEGTDWSEVEKQLAITLPADYKAFIDYYGAGWINDYIFVLTPTLEGELYNLKKKSLILIDRYKTFKAEFPDYYPHKIYPEKEGLFPCGYTEGGGHLYWETCEDPESWTIVIYGSGGGRWEEYKLSLTDFITKLLLKEIVSKMLPEDFADNASEFVDEED
ncbi:SMI1/KNR4 family protein [Zooshikella harenae]|uniref:SMI1/KNR4 family protein n=1 Tax=Zooshikella harenae TaxID=2827238 RepID=A0ABS5ZK45_9GAMM|nr:SMI1/KNR4 family protein [Zooshikella harenae]MBU2714459.1 SMI1/KNR4 family protein [Zooshikella harenae]